MIDMDRVHEVAQRMKETLGKVDLPSREIHVCGSFVQITTKGEATARKWASLLAKFSKVKGVYSVMDGEAGEYTKVWRVAAYI